MALFTVYERNEIMQSNVGARLSIMMFLQFFIWGSWFVTVNIFMDEMKMSESIHWAYTVGPIAAMISPIFLGMIADRFFATERVLGVMHILGGIVILFCPFLAGGDKPWWLFILGLQLHTLLYMPTLGLANTLAFHNMTNQEKQFPLIRVFGTIGWIVAGVVISKGLEAERTAYPFYMAGGAAILLGLYSFTLPHTPPPAKGKKATLRDIFCLDALSLLKSRSFFVFMVSSILICIPLAAYYAYASLYLEKSGMDNPAFKMTFGQMSEIFFMLVMPFFFARLGVKWMLLVGMLAWVTRYGLFAGAAGGQVYWMMMIGVILHGICYDFFFVTGQIYVDKKAPKEIRGAAQGFLVQMTLGLGMFIGAQASGKIFNTYTSTEGVIDWQYVWLIPAAFAAVVMVIFGLLFKDEVKSQDSQGEMEEKNNE
jgi:nucleoside transporter